MVIFHSYVNVYQRVHPNYTLQDVLLPKLQHNIAGWAAYPKPTHGLSPVPD